MPANAFGEPGYARGYRESFAVVGELFAKFSEAGNAGAEGVSQRRLRRASVAA